jgi:hypothetical protein
MARIRAWLTVALSPLLAFCIMHSQLSTQRGVSVFPVNRDCVNQTVSVLPVLLVLPVDFDLARQPISDSSIHQAHTSLLKRENAGECGRMQENTGMNWNKLSPVEFH